MEDKTVIYLDLEDDDMYSGMEAISFVDAPATEVNWLAFSKDGNKKQLFERNESKRIVTAPVMLAETEIYRHSEELGDYYVKFSADMIHRMRNKYAMEGRQNSVNEDHDSKKKVNNVFMVESFIVGDKVESKVYPYLPDGTWVASFYIADETYWKENIMSDKFKGFSLEGFFIENYEMQKIEEKYSKVREVLESDKHDTVKRIKIKAILELN